MSSPGRPAALHYRASVPEIHAELVRRGVAISQRSVTNLLDRYDELVATAAGDPDRLQRVRRPGTGHPGDRRPAAADGPRGAVGDPRLPVRHRRAGQGPAVVDSRRPRAAAAPGCRARRRAGGRGGQRRTALDPHRGCSGPAGVPHQLCHFHYLREAARPIFEADRHAKKELKKRVRGIRPIERAAEAREDAEGDLNRGCCAAERSALGDDGRAPLAAAGLTLKARLETVSDSLQRVAAKERRAADPGAEPADRPCPGRHQASVAGHRPGVRLGASGGAHRDEHRGAAGAGGGAAAGRPVWRDVAAPRTGRRAVRCGRSLPQGNPQLSSRPVPVPCRI